MRLISLKIIKFFSRNSNRYHLNPQTFPSHAESFNSTKLFTTGQKEYLIKQEY